MDGKYYRSCPNCEIQISYNRISDMKIATVKNSHCDKCKYSKLIERDNIIIYHLNNTELTHNELSKLLGVSISIISKVKKKNNIIRETKLSNDGKQIRVNNFKKNILDKQLNLNGGIKSVSHYEKIFKSRYGYEYSEFLKEQPEYKKYWKEVRNVTNKNLRKYKHLFSNLDKLGRCGDTGKFQIDHKFSIKEGFIQGISPILIGHPSNLEIIKWEDNLNKSTNCNVTVDELISETTLFLTKNHKILI